MIQLTPNQFERQKREWSLVAGEKIELEYINETLYAFGSELATLRLFKAYQFGIANGTIRQGFSANMNTYYFCLDFRAIK